jgi:SAM-dependent methyltransferase
MASDLSAYRASPREQARVRSLLDLVPPVGTRALDVGARDGHLSFLLAERFEHVVSLDLERPNIEHPRVEAVQGDAARLQYPDDSFDVVVCAEVLEHIPSATLPRVASEIARVAASVVVIGVPYRQDLRIGRTTCPVCGHPNPPWGHVNTFDESALQGLFPGLTILRTDYVGENRERTNWLAAWLTNYAGNPYGTYEQEEPCVHCGARLLPPPARSLTQKVAYKLGYLTARMQSFAGAARPNWVHIAFTKEPSEQPRGSAGRM